MQRIFWLLVWLPCMAGLLWAGDAPTISGLPGSFTMNRDTTSPTMTFSIFDNDTPSNQLTLSATATNQTLFPNGNAPSGSYTFGTSGQNQTLTIKPAANQSGTAKVTVTVSDGTSTANQQIDVTVNAPPSITALPTAVTTDLNTETTAQRFVINDDLTALGNLVITTVSSNQTLILNNAFRVTAGTQGNRDLFLTPINGQTGTTRITVTVKDGGDLTASQIIEVTVNAPPAISGLPDTITINQFNNLVVPSASYTFTVTDDATVPASLTTTATSLDTTIIANAGCVITTITPTVLGGPNRQLTVTPLQGKFTDSGVTVRVSVTDGRIPSIPKNITVTVKEVNRPPVITPAPTPHNYSLKVGGYTQILAEAINVTDPDGQPTLKTGSDYLRIAARIAVNRVANEDSMELRTTEKCKLVRNGANYDIKWLTTNGTQLAEVTTANDGLLTITVKDGAQTVANSGTPAVGSATVLAELLKTINYTNQAGRFANITLATRTVEIQVIEGRPTNMPGGLTPTTLTSVITLLLDNEPPSNVAFATVVVSPGGQGRIVFAADQSGSIPRFDLQTENDALQISVNSPPNGGQVIDLVTNEVLTTNVPGSRLNPANAGGIGYRNGNPNFASDGFTLRVADAGNLGTIANVLVRIDSNATGDTRFVSDPLLVIDRGTSKVHQVTIVGPTLTDVVLGVTKINGQVLSPSPLTWPAGVLKTDANGSAQTTLTINAPATGTYLEFMLTCTIGGSTAKQPYLIRLTPVVPFAASN